MAAENAISLEGKVAVVTGAGRGIGRAVALALSRAGAAVLVNDVVAEAVETVVADIRAAGGEAEGMVAAIGPAPAAEACVQAAVSRLGGLDILCANAGILRDNVLWKTPDESFDAVIDTHLRGTFTCARAAARHFRGRPGGGRLILLSSIAGQKGNFGQTAYAAAKAGIAAMARTWSLELARDGVTVNAIVPNAMTAMTATIPALAPHAEALERGEALPPSLRRGFGLGTAADVAPLFVFLASDRAAGITGQCVGIGGDRLSLWSHPAEIVQAYADGGWDAGRIAAIWDDTMAPFQQAVGIDLPQPKT
ncbi:MAG: SDR family oxidoreductase [Azospirillaceae bacterium]